MTSVDQLFEQAMKLSEAEREELADRLFQSTLPEVPGEEISPDEWEKAWGEEIKRRIEQMDRGEVDLKDAFESLEELRRQLHAGSTA